MATLHALAGAGLLITLLAPIIGQRSDASGRRKFWLAVNTFVIVALSACMFFVQPAPEFLLLGLVLVAAGNVFFEFASVNYNAILTQISTPRTIGRVSGFGWGIGYIGGIVLLLIVYFGFIKPDIGLFSVTGENGMDVRVTMLVAAAWFGLFALPVLFAVPEYTAPAGVKRDKIGFFASYGRLGRDIAKLWRESRLLVFFLHDGGQIVFWTAGLALCLFVGPAQSASRTFLARLIPEGREGEVFGLYATTGRAVSFLAPMMFALFVTWFGAPYFGILGIMVVIALGLAMLIPVKAAQQQLR
ncbi:vacuole effluxer Atg22 like-domain-containing protein [Podospora conica]|nr:vacuole effluxer Atg22 like-domain-containing protein [Schizothecium conicum]